MYGVLALVGGREPTPFFRVGIVVSIVANHISKSMFGMQLYSTKGLLGITRGVAPRSRPGGLLIKAAVLPFFGRFGTTAITNVRGAKKPRAQGSKRGAPKLNARAGGRPATLFEEVRMKFNWKKALPAFLTGGSWIVIAILWGFEVPMTFYGIIAPAVASILGIILGIIWTPPNPAPPA